MKKILIIKFLLIYISINAQLINLVEYDVTYNDDAGGVQKEYLIFNDTELYYVNITNEDNLFFEDENLEKKRFNYEPLFIDLKNDSLYQEKIGILKPNSSKIDRFILKEKRPIINWSITKDSKKILNYTCFKAIATFRGRVYTVWFTTDIPYNYGPWKLGNLPGLILKVENDLLNYEARRIVLNSKEIQMVPSLKKLGRQRVMYDLNKTIEFENNWLMFNKSNILASLPAGTTVNEKPLRDDVRELSIDE